ncbi:MAG: aminoacyl-tRNA hydrolase [Eubacteriales bacterium]
MFFKKNTGTISWLLVCLGNPGEKYHNTRHNIGFMVADYLAEQQNVPLRKIKFQSTIGELKFGEERVLLLKPQTFMNLSGEAVIAASGFYKIPPERILVVSDEVAFAIGRLKISAKGSAGGHNGLKNIISHLGTENFPRIRIGVGEKPHADYDMADWVLGKFAPEDKIEEVVKKSADAIEVCFTQGFDSAMAQFHGTGKNTPKKKTPKEQNVQGETETQTEQQ